MAEIDWSQGTITPPAGSKADAPDWESGVITPPPKPAGAIRRIADSGLALAKGVIGVPEAAVGMADLVTGGRAGKIAEAAGVRFKDAKQVLADWQSPEQHAADAEVQAADGFLPTLGAMVKNPSTIVNATMESAPSMILGAGVARGAMALAPKLGAIGAGALGEGAVAAGQNAEQVRQEDPTGQLTAGQSAVLAGSGAVTGAISRLSGGIANRLGIGDIQTMLAAGKTGAIGEKAVALGARKGIARKAAEGFAIEGGLQELPQSYQEQVGQNIAQGKPWDEGAGTAGAQGLLVGGLTGAIAGPMGGHPAPAPVAPPAGPLARAAALALPAPVVRVDSAGRAAMDGVPTGTFDEGRANVVGRAPIAPEPSGPMTRALPAPAVTVDEQGNALTTEQRNAMLSAQPEPGPRETGNIGQGRNSEPVQSPAARAPQLPFDNSPTGTLVAGPDGVMVERRPQVVARANAERVQAGDILGDKDQPFNGAIAAARAARLAGPGFAPVKIGQGKYVVRRAQDVTDVTAKPVDEAAHATAATSPLNDIPQPTDAQKEAGNYSKGHVSIAGLNIAIENPQGSTRSGTDPDGKAWETTMQAHYGYVKGTTGKDGDQVDVFVKPGTDPEHAGPVFVVDQIDPKTGKLDEHKAVIGATDKAEAEAIYRSNYSADWQGFGAISEMPLAAFRSWVKDGTKTKPLGTLAAPAATAAPAPVPASGSPAPEAVTPGSVATSEPGPIAPGEPSPALTNVQTPPPPPGSETQPPAGKAPSTVGSAAPAQAAVPGAGKPAEVEAAGVKPLSVGMLPNQAELVTVKNGIVHIGKAEAVNFDSGEPVKVPEGASNAQIKQALKDAGAISKRQKFFGGQEASTTAAPVASIKDVASSAPTNANLPVVAAKPGDLKATAPNVVVRDVRDFNGNKLGDIVEPHDGTKEGILAAAARMGKRMQDEFSGASNSASRIGATDENGQPAWAISPNLAHIDPIGTREAAYTWGDLSAAPDKPAEPATPAIESKAEPDYAKSRPANWRTNFMVATQVGKAVGIPYQQGRKLADLVAMVDEKDNEGAAPVDSERLQSAHIGGVQAGAATSRESAKSGTAEPFEHAGRRVYPTRIKAGDGVRVRWAVQSQDNIEREQRGERQAGGDTLADNPEQARQIAEQEAKRAESDAKSRTALDEAERQQAADKAKAEDIDGFRGDSTPMARGLAVKTLLQQVRHNGMAITRRDMIRNKVNAGATIETVDGERRLSAPDGAYLAQEQTTKIGMDYAAFLVGKYPASSPEQPPAAAKPEGGAVVASQAAKAPAPAADPLAQKYEWTVANRPAEIAVGLSGDAVPMAFQQRQQAQKMLDNEPKKLRDQFRIVAIGSGAGRRFYVVPTLERFLSKNAGPEAATPNVAVATPDVAPEAARQPADEYPLGKTVREDRFHGTRVRVKPSMRGEEAWEGTILSTLNGGRLFSVRRDGKAWADGSVRIGGERIEVIERKDAEAPAPANVNQMPLDERWDALEAATKTDGGDPDKGQRSFRAFTRLIRTTGEKPIDAWTRWNSFIGSDNLVNLTGEQVVKWMGDNLTLNLGGYVNDLPGSTDYRSGTVRFWQGVTESLERRREAHNQYMDKLEKQARDVEELGGDADRVAKSRNEIQRATKAFSNQERRAQESLKAAEAREAEEEKAREGEEAAKFRAFDAKEMSKKPSPASVVGWFQAIYKGADIWTNGHIADLSGEPHMAGWKDRQNPSRSAVRADLGRVVPKDKGTAATPIGWYDGKVGDAKGAVYFEYDDSVIAADVSYVRYFLSKYKGATFTAAGEKAPIQVWDGKTLVGVVMPINMKLSSGETPSLDEIKAKFNATVQPSLAEPATTEHPPPAPAAQEPALPIWQADPLTMSREDYVTARVDSAQNVNADPDYGVMKNYSSARRLNEWRKGFDGKVAQQHFDAAQAAVDAGRTLPPQVLYDYPQFIRTDLSDEAHDEAMDAMVSEYEKTKDYAKAVQVVRDWGKGEPTQPAPAKEAAPRSAATIAREIAKARPDDAVADVREAARKAIIEQLGQKALDAMDQGTMMTSDELTQAIHDGQYAAVREFAANMPVPVHEGDIPRAAADRAHQGTSFSPEKRGASEQRDYVRTMVDAWKKAERATKGDPAALARVTDVMQGLVEGYRSRVLAELGASSRIMSSMIAGPAKFPVARMRKANEIADKRRQEASEFLTKGINRMLRAARAPIDNSPDSELARVKANLEAREARQDLMKKANAAIRKGDDAALKALGLGDARIAELKKGQYGHPGFQPYELSNNNAEIARLRERLKSAEERSADAAAGPVQTERNGVKIEENATDDRLRLIFEGKPDEAVRTDLKAAGFRWSPNAGAWQRQLTDNARAAAQTVLDKHFPQEPAQFKRAEQSQGAMPRTSVDRAVSELTRDWLRKPEIIILDDMQDEKTPKSVRNQWMREGGTDVVNGFHMQGTVYIVADAIGNIADLRAVLNHETFHFGLRGYFGDALTPVLQEVIEKRKIQVAVKARAYGLAITMEQARAAIVREREAANKDPLDAAQLESVARRRMEHDTSLAAEEVIAELAQTRPDLPIVQRLIAVIKTWLREHVAAFKDMALSDADIIAKYILPARGWVERARNPKAEIITEPETQFAKGGRVLTEADRKLAAMFAGPDSGFLDNGGKKIDPSAHYLVNQDTGEVVAGPFKTVNEANEARGENTQDRVTKGSQIPKGDTPQFSRTAMAGQTQAAVEKVSDLFRINVPGKLNWWHRTVGTMQNLALRSPEFKRVYDSVQNFINDVSYFATEAADLAPSILPKLESWKDILKSPLSAQDTKAVSAPVFQGTLSWTRDAAGNPAPEADPQKAGIVWTDAELADRFHLNPTQIGLYHEFRDATNKSLSNLAISDMIRFAGKDAAPIRDMLMEDVTVQKAADTLTRYLKSLANAEPERAAVLNDTAEKVQAKAERAQELMAKGYAPLSRFGHYTLSGTLSTGEQYFGMFESPGETRKMRNTLSAAGATNLTAGTLSQEAYKIFAGVSPETVELFGDMLGLEAQGDSASAKAFQEFLKLARSNRSAMKRLIERKGVAGFSEDAGRVLAGFVYSNARQTSNNLHMGDMTEHLMEMKDGAGKQNGELFDTAAKLVEYIKNPQEEAQKLRGLLFAQYIGGSVASAMVNLTQPITMTLPYLSQYGGITKAGQQMGAAFKDALKARTGDNMLDAALHKAEEEGIVSPQEVHQLMQQAQGAGTLKAGDGTAMGDAAAKASNALSKLGLAWGKVFSSAEQFNRRVTFIAAYRTAVEQGMRDPAGFAAQAIAETQGVYNKGNKPAWARGAIGSTIFTFKQYSIAYVEMVHRMATQGGPDGKKAALYSMAILFLLSGASGLPGADDLDDLISGAMQALGYNFDSRSARNAFLAGVLGDGGAQFVERGISGLSGVPIDVSGRLGMGKLIPGTGLLTKKTDHSRDVSEFAGPAGDLAARAFKAAGSAITGDFGAATNAIAPKAIQNLSQAYDMATMGMYRDQSGKKVLDTNGFDAFNKAMGFQPNDVKKVQDATREVQQRIALNKIRESEIADRWALGIFEKNQSKIDAAKDDVREWNSDNPESPIRINYMQVAKRVHAMNMTKEERIARTAPKEIRASVLRELQAAR